MSAYQSLTEMFQERSIPIEDHSGKEQILVGIVDELVDIIDPHLGVDVLTLELIRGVSIDNQGNVEVTMTLTTPACPHADVILTAVKSGVERLPDVKDVTIKMSWEPLWAPSENLKMHLGFY